jgi:hypothetical protein
MGHRNVKNVPLLAVLTATPSALVSCVMLRTITSQMELHALNVLWLDVKTAYPQRHATTATKLIISSFLQAYAPNVCLLAVLTA